MSIGKKVVDKVSKVLNIPNFLKETVTRVLKIQPDKIIICGYNTKTQTIASGGAGELGTSDAVLMLTSALASVYLELPKDGDKRFPINDFMSSMNVMTLDAIQKRDPQAIYSSTVPVEDHRKLPDQPFPPTAPVPPTHPVEVQESVVEETPVNEPQKAKTVKRVRKTPVKKDNK
ncbi:hypothetical protein Presley_49 [Acinetobacter phage Presley]|uniref:Uncharacterized protein n=1 Tax=Acinetobacter phage Presley TaxID=1406780 RepID=U5PWJ2_9CAUD|nr:hypothetical protein Presley_49 [Acinetobacter phage Presley]AGY48116.1 hypothetical protein Presley_49 [Acinetobacter phage Presley]